MASGMLNEDASLGKPRVLHGAIAKPYGTQGLNIFSHTHTPLGLRSFRRSAFVRLTEDLRRPCMAFLSLRRPLICLTSVTGSVGWLPLKA